MRRVLSCVVVASLTLVLTAAAAPTEKDRVARLIADLGSERYEVRQAASKELDSLGATALDELKRAAASADDEIRHRAQVIAQAISQRLETERLLTPSRVRLVCKDTPIPDAVADLAKKTGFNIQLEGDKAKLATKRITLDTGDTTFWDALNQLCDKAALTEKRADQQNVEMTRRQMMLQRRVLIMRGNGIAYGGQAPGDSTIHLKEGKVESMATCQTNALRVRVLPGSPRAGQSSGQTEVSCTLEMTAEPKIQLLRILPPQVQSAEDDKGLKLTYVPQPDEALANPYDAMAAMRGIGAAGQYGHNHVVRFKLRDGSAKKISKLKGSMLIEMVAPPGPLVTVNDVLKVEGKTFTSDDGHSLKLTQVKQEGDQLKLKVVLDTPVDGMNPWGNAAVFVNQAQLGQVINEASTGLHLEDAKGKRIAATGVSNVALPVFNGRSNVNEYLLTYRIAKDQEPARLVLTGRRTAVLDVPFELKDVPLAK